MNKYLKFFRVSDWVHILGLTVLGFCFASEGKAVFYNVFFALLVSSLYLAHGYALNECFDTIINSRYPQGNFIPFQTAILFSYAVLVLNLFISFHFSKNIFGLVIIGTILAWLYSAPPVRAKKKLFLGFLFNSIGFSILFLIGYASLKMIDMRAILMTVFFIFLFFPIELIHELNDFEKDRLGGINTIVVKFGMPASFFLIVISAIILIGYTYLVYFLFNISIALFGLTVLFSIALILYLFKQFDKHKGKFDTDRLKLHIRYICIIYGIGILVSFYF